VSGQWRKVTDRVYTGPTSREIRRQQPRRTVTGKEWLGIRDRWAREMQGSQTAEGFLRWCRMWERQFGGNYEVKG